MHPLTQELELWHLTPTAPDRQVTRLVNWKGAYPHPAVNQDPNSGLPGDSQND